MSRSPFAVLAHQSAFPICYQRSAVANVKIDTSHHALRPLLASVGALVVSTSVYGTDSQFGADGPDPTLIARLERAVTEALLLAGALSSPDVIPPVSHPSS